MRKALRRQTQAPGSVPRPEIENPFLQGMLEENSYSFSSFDTRSSTHLGPTIRALRNEDFSSFSDFFLYKKAFRTFYKSPDMEKWG